MESNNFIEIFDTTLRDGTQGEKISMSIHDKLTITQRLDEFGIDIVEGGWPGSNPKDEEYFERVKKISLSHAQICAFGSTARYPDRVRSDHNLNLLIAAETPIISLFGKAWRFHSRISLGLTDEQNEDLIYESISFLKNEGRKIVFDAEHFFDGYRDDPQFALTMLRAAGKAGADVIVLCDTNGGTLPSEVRKIVKAVRQDIRLPLGIHAHNDGDVAVASTLAALEEGVSQVQGTINGVGERCGNANLCSILPNILLKMNRQTISPIDLKSLHSLSHYVYEVMNLVPNTRAAFVGNSAFAHKGGIHVSSVLKDSRMYEHIDPSLVGNKQHVLISDLSGQSNIKYLALKLGINLPAEKEFSQKIVQHIKRLEFQGFQFDGAEASFELLLRAELKQYKPYFHITYAKVNVMFDSNGDEYAEAVLKVKVGQEEEHTAADGLGPVNALDNALRKALLRFFPAIKAIHLVDYKVRVLGEENGTGAKVRVLVESSDGSDTWSTVGVSHNIIKASLQAICDSINYKIFYWEKNAEENFSTRRSHVATG